jgi:hypothetical protein
MLRNIGQEHIDAAIGVIINMYKYDRGHCEKTQPTAKKDLQNPALSM